MAGTVLLGAGLVWVGVDVVRGQGAPPAAHPGGLTASSGLELPGAAPGDRNGEGSPFAWLLPPESSPEEARPAQPVEPAAQGAFPATSLDRSAADGRLTRFESQEPPIGMRQEPPTGMRQQPQEPYECMPFQAPGPPREFHFTRGIYSSGRGGFGWGRRGSWCIDHPKAETQFLGVLDRLTGIDAYPYGNAIALDDPELRRFPILYMLEVGRMSMTESEVEGLRSYLLAGGTLIIDDFWGSRQWFNFEMEMARVFPDLPIVDLEMDHAVYRTYYQIDTVLQVPAFSGWGDYSDTSEQDGYDAYNRAIFSEDGRLMVAINWNTDLGDAWEWMEQPSYPLRFSTYAYQMGVNYIVYGMSN